MSGFGVYGVGALIAFFVSLAVYLIPSLIALIRRNNRTKVILFNIFLGWTVVLWVFCMIWAIRRDDVICPKCGFKVEDGKEFCPQCGLKVQ